MFGLFNSKDDGPSAKLLIELAKPLVRVVVVLTDGTEIRLEPRQAEDWGDLGIYTSRWYAERDMRLIYENKFFTTPEGRTKPVHLVAEAYLEEVTK